MKVINLDPSKALQVSCASKALSEATASSVIKKATAPKSLQSYFPPSASSFPVRLAKTPYRG
jgi:hypothetical protein